MTTHILLPLIILRLKEFDKLIKEYCDKDKYNEAISKQYQWMQDEGRYTESSKFINKLVEAII